MSLNVLEKELTTGFWASVGIPESLIKASDRCDEAEALVDAGLARWDRDDRHGLVLKMVGRALWDQVMKKVQIAAEQAASS